MPLDTVKPLVRWSLAHKLPYTLMCRAGRRGDLQGSLVAAGPTADTTPLWEQLRAAGPLYRGKYGYVATRMSVAREVLTSPDVRSGIDLGQLRGISRLYTWAAGTARLGPLEPPSLLVTEPPEHTRYRRLVAGVFSMRAVEDLRVRTEQIAHDLLDRLAAGPDKADIVTQYCAQLPVTVICEILGVPPAERERVRAFGEVAAPSLDMGLRWRQFRATEAGLVSFDGWLDAHIARVRRAPQDDLLSQLIAATDAEGGLTEEELKATAGLVLIAGFETTVNLLGNAVALLDEYPEQRELLVADSALWPNAVEEILRLDPPVLLTARMTTRATEIAGVPVPPNALVSVLLAAANRDPALFTDPARFDVRRPNAREHLSFSLGRHHCLGAALARMEGGVGLRALYERFPQISRTGAGQRRTTRILRGYHRMPVALGAAA